MAQKSISENLRDTHYDATVDLYRQRAKDLAAEKSGLTRYIVRLIGPELMGSIACALDPWAKFRIMTYKTAPAKRLRKFSAISGVPRSWENNTLSITRRWGTYPVWHDATSSYPSFSSGATSPQLQVNGFIKDTTARSRTPDVPFGEFELFKPSFESSGYSCEVINGNHTTADGSNGDVVDQKTVSDHIFHGPNITVAPSSVDTLAGQCAIRAQNAFSTLGLKLVGDTLPTSNRYNLSYQIGELRDLTQTVRGTLSVWISIERTLGPSAWKRFVSKQRLTNSEYQSIEKYADSLGFVNRLAAGAYLTWLFGWQSMLQAAKQLADKPERITKEVNFLIDRQSKSTTLRKKRSFPLVSAAPPSFGYYLIGSDILDSMKISTTGSCELRCVINATWDFPPLDLPALRSKLFWEKLGADVTPSVIYDLIPWTWLYDWFTGLGDYIHCMELITSDKSLINYGFLTYIENMQVTVSIAAHREQQLTTTISVPYHTETATTKVPFNIGAVYRHKYQLRQSLSSQHGVKTPSSIELSSSQKTILWALLSTR